MDKLDIQSARNAGVEDGVPVLALSLQRGRQDIQGQIAELVADVWDLGVWAAL